MSTLADLNAAAAGTTPAVIYVTGNIAGNVTVGSNKTIAGVCGGSVTGHISIDRSYNVIVRNLTVTGYNCTDDAAVTAQLCSAGADGITVINGAHHIWFDHDDISDGSDGNLDVTQGADFVTVSWTKFHYSSARVDLSGPGNAGATGHRFSNLIGASDNNPLDVGHLNVTFHHDWWADHVDQRMPRTRSGQIHVFDNLYTATANTYCIGIGILASVRDEENVFIGSATPVNTTSFANATSSVTSVDNLYMGTTGAAVADLGTAFTPPYAYVADPASMVQAEVQAGAGPQ